MRQFIRIRIGLSATGHRPECVTQVLAFQRGSNTLCALNLGNSRAVTPLSEALHTRVASADVEIIDGWLSVPGNGNVIACQSDTAEI